MTKSNRTFGLLRVTAVWAATMASCTAVNASDLSRLESLLAATPLNGWVQINTNTFSDAFLPDGASHPDGASGAVVRAWSSAAWDSQRGDLIIYGGGHANYAGNEVYVLDGQSGLWSRGSLPSRLESGTLYVVDNAAPQAAHTYDNNLYLPINDRFITFGGAAYNSGGNYQSASGRTGPWVWDPAKANPNLVGGTSGSGYNTSTAGGNMWTNLSTSSVGSQPANFVESATAYRTEAGKDVVYVSAPNAGGFVSLYRYEVGDLSAGGSSTWQTVGQMTSGANTFQHVATIDTVHGLYLATVTNGAGEALGTDLSVWNLSNNNAADPNSNGDIAIKLVNPDGTPFVMSKFYGIDADTSDGSILLWNQQDGGTVYRTKAAYDATGKLKSTWVIDTLLSTTSAKPSTDASPSGGGVLGKWDYVAELDAFVALETYTPLVGSGFGPGTGDAKVWLYKVGDLTAAVPEPSTGWLMLAAIGFGAGLIRRRKGKPEGLERAVAA